jgi:hypothetical protein
MTFDLGAQAHPEAPPGEALQVPGHLGYDHGAMGKGDCDAGAQVDALGIGGSHDQGQEGIVAAHLRRHEAVEAQLLGLPGGGGDFVEAEGLVLEPY